MEHDCIKLGVVPLMVLQLVAQALVFFPLFGIKPALLLVGFSQWLYMDERQQMVKGMQLGAAVVFLLNIMLGTGLFFEKYVFQVISESAY